MCDIINWLLQSEQSGDEKLYHGGIMNPLTRLFSEEQRPSEFDETLKEITVKGTFN